MLSTIGRAAVRRIGGGASTSTNRALRSLWQLHRTESTSSHKPSIAQPLSWHQHSRCYATASSAAAKPKATKPKTAATKTKSTTKKSTTTKSAKAKKPAAKKKAAKKKAAKKKAAKKKPAAKKPAKKKTKVVLTDEQKARAEIKKLKIKALVAEEPTALPSTAWQVLFQRDSKTSKGRVSAAASSASARYKSLSPSEIEELNHEANTNKARSETAHKQWVESYTPAVINEANNARRVLRRRLDTTKFRLLQDPRLPKRPIPALLIFTKERHASGDLKNVGDFKAVSEFLTKEWRSLSDVDRKKYEDAARSDKQRYIQEYKTVFHKDSTAKL